MGFETIRKGDAARTGANMPDYAAACAAFDWEEARRWLDYLPGGGLNIAHEAIDRHVAQGRGDRTALRWLGKSGETRNYSYVDLKSASGRFARLLADLGHGKGARVFTLLGRRPELYITALGALKAGAVFCPLYSAFGPEPVQARMTIGEANLLVTTAADYERKVAPWRHQLPSLRHVLIVDEPSPSGTDVLGFTAADYERKVAPWRRQLPSLRHVLIVDEPSSPGKGALGFTAACANVSAELETVRTDPSDLALLHFTSGTTGKPKGAMHVHEAVVAHHATGRLALDLRPHDIFWCTADPGWVTGTSYGIIAPLTNGVTMLVDEAEFDAERWYSTLAREQVTVWYTAPTAIRLLMKAGDDLPQRFDLSRLRFMASVGEPLNAGAVVWSAGAFGHPFHDNWWQTETGGIMIANYASMDVKPGSMGKPLPGVEAAIVERADNRLRMIETPMTPGQLALRPGWPSMFRGYLYEEARYAACFVDGWYLSGDLAMRDADGYYWFVGRADDVIKSAGHLIGPFEVESALMEHPAVAEAAVIGLPDERAGEIVKAYVGLKHGHEPTEALRKDILGHARKRLGAAIAPRQIAFCDQIPRTRSGKIMRRLLKARELGLPEGDLSTLETGA